jgi:3D (Asp-Asp-Asp) domain-containing protein
VLPASRGAGPAQRAAALRADDAGLAAQARAAVLELYSIDERLTEAEARLAGLRTAAARLRAQRVTLAHELRIASVDARLSQSRLATRLRLLYEHGAVSSLDLVLGAKSLEDAMAQLDGLDRVAAANAYVLVQVRQSHHHLVRLARTMGARERALAATTLAAEGTVAELGSLRSSRSAYLGELASRRALDAARIAELNAQAAAAVARSRQLAARVPPAPAPALAPTPAPAPVPTAAAAGGALVPRTASLADSTSLTVTATGYDLPGHTSTGLPVGWGIAAVDPSVIPLGTRIVVPGYGVAVAADTGGAIQGATIDLWFPSAAQAYAWGRRTVTIAVGQS